jgi:formylglycine-generating enzyme required for sulfatase activity
MAALSVSAQHPLLNRTMSYMKPINDSLYAQAFEVSNRDYHLFLEALLQEGDRATWNACVPDTQQWFYIGSNFLINLYHRDERYADYPVVNISQKAARHYCRWLTRTYMVWDKRPYKRVEFRLPANDTEWSAAARGTLLPTARYPWGRDALQDPRGAYYCNFNRLIQQPPDTNRLSLNNGINEVVGRISRGSFLLCPVNAFAPNSIGLYNICGNVAEMLDLNNRTKGGSWDSDGKFMPINALDEYNGKPTPNPFTGFRVFMYVWEK